MQTLRRSLCFLAILVVLCTVATAETPNSSALDDSAEMMLEGGGFWSGVACGLGIVFVIIAATSPDPFSKIALATYGASALGCVLAFV